MPTFLSAMLTTGHWAVWIIGGAGLLVTLLPIFRQTAWWIRICDFPRLQIVAALLLSLVATVLLPGLVGPWAIGFAACLGVA